MRLEKLADEFGDDLEISWRSFMLRPEPEDRTMEEFQRYTESWKRPGAMEPAAEFNQWSGEHEPPSHSVPPLIASKAVADMAPEKWDAFHKALMHAYFVENRTISDLDVQFEVAESVGVDLDEMRMGLAERARVYATEIIAEHNQAVQSGVTGVPAVVLPGGFVIPGAQDLDTYRNIVKKLIDDQMSSETTDS